MSRTLLAISLALNALLLWLVLIDLSHSPAAPPGNVGRGGFLRLDTLEVQSIYVRSKDGKHLIEIQGMDADAGIYVSHDGKGRRLDK